jgi:hypothetical protein
MALYKLDTGKINTIDYRNCGAILTTSGTEITIRFAGDSSPFIQAKLEEFIDVSGNPFTDVAALITYWNANFVPLVIAS